MHCIFNFLGIYLQRFFWCVRIFNLIMSVAGFFVLVLHRSTTCYWYRCGILNCLISWFKINFWGSGSKWHSFWSPSVVCNFQVFYIWKIGTSVFSQCTHAAPFLDIFPEPEHPPLLFVADWHCSNLHCDFDTSQSDLYINIGGT